MNADDPASVELQERTRDMVRLMLRATDWSLNRLAAEAKLASSTLHRFMNKAVRHDLSSRTVLALLRTTVLRFGARVNANEKIPTSDTTAFRELLENYLDRDTLQKLPGTLSERQGLIAHAEEIESHIKNSLGQRIEGVFKDLEQAEPALRGRIDAQEFVQFMKETVKLKEFNDPQALYGALQAFAETRGFPRMRAPDDLPVITGSVRVDARQAPNLDLSFFVKRPFFLKASKTAFGFMMYGRSMEPRFFPGEILFVDPGTRLIPSRPVFVQTAGGEYIVGMLSRQDDNSIVFSTLSPRDERSMSRDEVALAARVVASWEP